MRTSGDRMRGNTHTGQATPTLRSTNKHADYQSDFTLSIIVYLYCQGQNPQQLFKRRGKGEYRNHVGDTEQSRQEQQRVRQDFRQGPPTSPAGQEVPRLYVTFFDNPMFSSSYFDDSDYFDVPLSFVILCVVSLLQGT